MGVVSGRRRAAKWPGPSRSADSASPGPPAPGLPLAGPPPSDGRLPARTNEGSTSLPPYHELEGRLPPDPPNPDCLALRRRGLPGIRPPPAPARRTEREEGVGHARAPGVLSAEFHGAPGTGRRAPGRPGRWTADGVLRAGRGCQAMLVSHVMTVPDVHQSELSRVRTLGCGVHTHPTT